MGFPELRPRSKWRLILLCGFTLVFNFVSINLPRSLHLPFNYAHHVRDRETKHEVLNVYGTDLGWLKDREDVFNKTNQRKLFLFAYMRGGSSLAGELFNCDPSATMWYEPGDAFFSAYYGLYQENLPQNDLYFSNMTRRRLGLDEQQAMADFYNSIFSCKYEELPPEAMGHYFLKESTSMDGYVKCLKGKRSKNININACKSHIKNICSKKMVELSLGAKCHMVIAAVKTALDRNASIRNESHLLALLPDIIHDNGVKLSHNNQLLQFVRHGVCIEQMRGDNAKCLDIAKRKCQRDRLVVVQVNRMNVEYLEPIIRFNPDIFVVHYTRDPRAIAFSRHRIGFLTFDEHNRSTLREAEYLCHKMREDIRQRRILEKKYPGVFTHLTYESLVGDPVGFAARIYGILNMTYPKGWRMFAARHMHGKSSGGNFGIVVQNATETAFKWKSNLTKHELHAMNRVCADVIADLGYEL